MKTIIIESISWQWLYATNLLIAYELVLNTKDTPLYYNPYSGISVKVVAAFGSLLKSYWDIDSPSFNSMELREASQDHPFVITAMMPGSGHNQQPNPPSESSGQEAPKALPQPIGYFTSLLYSDSGGDGGVPKQQPHTLGLNCFVHPCHGACQFRQSSDLSDSRALDCEESVTSHTIAKAEQSSCPHLANRHCSICNPVNGVTSDGVGINSMVAGTIDKDIPAGKAICTLIISGEGDQSLQCGKVFKNAKTLSHHKSYYHSGQKTCHLTVFGEDGQPQTCGNICKNAQALWNHKKRKHTDNSQQTCYINVIGEDGQPRPCRKIFKNADSLSAHRRGYHSGQRTCDLTVVGEDGQPKPCGKVLKNTQAFKDHKRRGHSKQTICDVTVIRKDGQPQSCGKVCKNGEALSYHKRMHRKRKSPVVTQNDDPSP